MKKIFLWTILLIGLIQNSAVGQGPPITGDKPVMLGANTWLVKSLTEIRNTDGGTLRFISMSFAQKKV